MNIPENATRIDLEDAGGRNVLTKTWLGNWSEGKFPDLIGYEVGTSIPALLKQCEEAGFTVEMCDPITGRALRGKITRIDILKIGPDWLIRKFPHGWTAKTHPISEEEKGPEFDTAKVIAWFAAHGWDYVQWEGGIRAWKGKRLPIRDASTIRHRRRMVDEQVRRGEGSALSHYDLRYYG